MNAPIAAKLVGSAAAQAKFANLYARMRASRARALISNPRTAGLYTGLSGDPTMSATAPAAGSNPATVLFNAVNGSTPSSLFAILGGWTQVSGSFSYPVAVTRALGETQTGGTTAVAGQTSHRIAFYSTAATVTVRLQTTQLYKVRVLVEGQYTSLTGYDFTATGVNNYLTLTFPARAPLGRLIEIETAAGNTQGGSNGNMLFGGVYQAANETIWAPEKSPRVIYAGDSYGIGAGASINGNGLAFVAKDYLGTNDLMSSSLSGSGYIVRPGGTQPALRDRLFDIIGNSPEALFLCNGTNEAGNEGNTYNGITVSTATTQAEATAQLQAFRSAKPLLPIIVFGPWRFASVTQRNRVALYEAAIQAAVVSLNDPMIVFMPTVGATPPYQNGTGYQGAVTYDGTNDWAMWTDATHPTDEGHAMLGQRLAADVMVGLKRIALNLGLPA